MRDHDTGASRPTAAAAEPADAVRATASSDHQPMTSELRAAIRHARIEEAERSGAIYDLRGAELARLEYLQEKLAPLFKSLPTGVDMFDHGVTPSEHPRYYVDLAAFVEMARDTRTYRFLLDTLEGRISLGGEHGREGDRACDHGSRRPAASRAGKGACERSLSDRHDRTGRAGKRGDPRCLEAERGRRFGRNLRKLPLGHSGAGCFCSCAALSSALSS